MCVCVGGCSEGAFNLNLPTGPLFQSVREELTKATVSDVNFALTASQWQRPSDPGQAAVLPGTIGLCSHGHPTACVTT